MAITFVLEDLKADGFQFLIQKLELLNFFLFLIKR